MRVGQVFRLAFGSFVFIVPPKLPSGPFVKLVTGSHVHSITAATRCFY